MHWRSSRSRRCRGSIATRVLALAALASSEADQDPIDAAIRGGGQDSAVAATAERLVRFVPFDPATKTSEAFAVDRDGKRASHRQGRVRGRLPGWPRRRRTRGARSTISPAQGHRVIAVAAGPPQSLRLVGLIALSDPPREDSAGLVAALRDMGVRTVMVTGDSP